MKQIKEIMQLLSVILFAGATFCDVASVPGETANRVAKIQSELLTDETLEKNLDKDVCMHNCEMNEVFPILSFVFVISLSMIVFISSNWPSKFIKLLTGCPTSIFNKKCDAFIHHFWAREAIINILKFCDGN